MNADLTSASMIDRARPGRARLALSSLRVRLLLIVLLAVVPAFGLILHTDAERRRQALVEAEGEAFKLATQFARDYQLLIEGGRQLLTAVSRLPEVVALNSAGCSALFSALIRDFPAYANLGAATPDGAVFCSAVPVSPDVNLLNRPHFRRAIETRQFVVSDVVTGQITKPPTIGAIAPILSADNSVRSVVFLALDQTWVTQRWDQTERPAGSRLIVFDRHGTVLGHSPSVPSPRAGEHEDWQVVQAALTQGAGVVRAEGLDRDPHLWGFTGLRCSQDTRLFAAVGIPAITVLASQQRIIRGQLVGLGVVAGLALVAAWVGGDLFIRRRMIALVEATRRLAAGDMRARSGMPHHADELGELARAFDRMAQALEDRQAQLGIAEVGRYSAETALEESEELLSLALDGVRDYAIFRLDTEGRVASWHGGARHLLGYPATEVLGKDFATLFAADAELGTADHLVDLAAAQGRAEVERLLVRQDGSHFLANIIVTSLRRDRRVAGFATVIRDITSARLAEEQGRVTTYDLAARNAVIAAVTSSLKFEEILAQLQTVLAQVLEAAGGTIFVYHGKHGRTAPMTSWGIPEESLATVCAATASYRMNAERLKGPVFIERPPMLEGWGAYICIPLLIADKLHGAIELLTREPQQRRVTEGAFLWVLGRNIAIGLNNARLYREVRAASVRRKRFSRRLLAVEEAERRRLACELHDEIGQALTSVKINLQVLQRASGVANLSARLDDSVGTVTRLLQQVRDISLDLRPSMLDDWGLLAAIRWYLERHTANLDLSAEVAAGDTEERFAPEIETACFRVVQEAVTNTVRHADARRVTVALEKNPGALELIVRDDGRGFDVAAARQRASLGRSLGILGMEERIRLLGGTLTITAAPEHGTEILVRVPIAPPGKRRGASA